MTPKQQREARFARRVLGFPRPFAHAARMFRTVRVDGNELDADAQLALELMAASKAPPLESLPVAHARKTYLRLRDVFDGPEIPLHDVRDIQATTRGGPLSLRVYRPFPSEQPLPILLYLHGGGFVMGDLDSHDPICRALAKAASCLVIAAHYRLAPEHPFPAAVEDGFDTFQWLTWHAEEIGGDPARIAIGGDSAGGNLALVTALGARDAGTTLPSCLLLVYPAVDAVPTKSRQLFADGFLLNAPTIDWFDSLYAGPHDDPRYIPLRAKSFAGLPPTLVITAGFDPLRDEGRACAERLAREGVPVTYRCYSGQFHGFFQMAGAIAAARDAIATCATMLDRSFSQRPSA